MPFKRKNFIGFDKYEKHGAYHWKAIELNEDYKRQSGYIINSANQLNPLLILDVGCGDGAIAGKIGSNLPASRVVGIDAEPMAIKLGNRELKKRNIENVHLINLTINDAYDALGSTKYNFIYSLDVIEHLPNPNELLEFSRSRLASNGILIVGTPLFISKQLVSPYHVKEFTISEIRHIVGESNIKEEVVIGGQRKDKNYYAENYYICKLSFS